jgi:hypothetical protein
MEKQAPKLKVSNGGNQEKKKYTYDELKTICNQLFEQNKYLAQKLQEATDENAVARMGFLFKVLEHKDFFEAETVSKCVYEIEIALGLKEAPAEAEKEKSDE